MATKFKVYADEQFLGHYYSSSGEGAVEKAIEKNFNYFPEIMGMPDCVFTVTKADFSHEYLWAHMPQLAEKFEIPQEDIDEG